MTSKKKISKASGASPTVVHARPDETQEDALARIAVEPCMTAAAVSVAFSRTFGDRDLGATRNTLLEQSKRVHDGNIQDVESTLVAQAAALNSIFTDLARSARRAEFLPHFEVNLKLALRAQNQCRMTLETLATIKNPPVVFAKQANIAHGHQQVNNGDAAPVTRAGRNGKAQTGLLETPHAKPKWMDAGAARAATPSDPAMAAVEAIDGAAHESRQGKVKPQRLEGRYAAYAEDAGEGAARAQQVDCEHVG